MCRWICWLALECTPSRRWWSCRWAGCSPTGPCLTWAWIASVFGSWHFGTIPFHIQLCAPLDGTTMTVNVEYMVKCGILSSGSRIWWSRWSLTWRSTSMFYSCIPNLTRLGEGHWRVGTVQQLPIFKKMVKFVTVYPNSIEIKIKFAMIGCTLQSEKCQ